jgi:uncharacterized protein YidB (DUF937 family)
MGLFDQVMGALSNPNQQANPNQLSSILNTVQQLSGQQGADGNQTQLLMSVVGGYVRSALREKRSAGGAQQVASLINQFSGTQANPSALSALFTQPQQQQMVQDAAQRTGLDMKTVQSMLPVVVPVVLNFLKAGEPQGADRDAPQNTVLSAFLDTNNDGEVDMGDALSMAGRFLNRG